MWQADFDKQGYALWTVKIEGKKVSRKVTPEDVVEFGQTDTTYVQDAFPPHTDVLTIHGMRDTMCEP